MTSIVGAAVDGFMELNLKKVKKLMMCAKNEGNTTNRYKKYKKC